MDIVWRVKEYDAQIIFYCFNAEKIMELWEFSLFIYCAKYDRDTYFETFVRTCILGNLNYCRGPIWNRFFCVHFRTVHSSHTLGVSLSLALVFLIMQNFIHKRKGGIKIRENMSRISRVLGFFYLYLYFLTANMNPYYALLLSTCYTEQSRVIKMGMKNSLAWCLFKCKKSLKSINSDRFR